jgi:hypothetical protein
MKDDFLEWTTNPIAENIIFMEKGVDGLFTEFPHMTKAVYTQFKSENRFPEDFGIADYSLEKCEFLN